MQQSTRLSCPITRWSGLVAIAIAAIVVCVANAQTLEIAGVHGMSSVNCKNNLSRTPIYTRGGKELKKSLAVV